MLLNLEIKDICITIHILRRDLHSTEQKIIQTLPLNVYKRFFNIESKTAHRIFLTHKQTCKSKFESLCRLKDDDHHRISGSWFTNLTDSHIPPTVTKILCLGNNFGIPVPNNQVPTKNLVADFESNIHKIDEDKRNAARLKFVNCISNFSRQRRTHTTSQNEKTQDIKSTKISLKNNPNILITMADKGNTTATLDKTKYLNEIKTMLSDSSTYIPLKKDPTNTTQKKVNDLKTLGKEKLYQSEYGKITQIR